MVFWRSSLDLDSLTQAGQPQPLPTPQGVKGRWVLGGQLLLETRGASRGHTLSPSSALRTEGAGVSRLVAKAAFPRFLGRGPWV